MFKLLTLLSSFSFISVPTQQVYQHYRSTNSPIKSPIQEEKSTVEEKEAGETAFGSSGDTVGREATLDEIAKFDYLVPNWQWFTKLSSDSAIGYTDLGSTLGSSGTGLCEYISMAMLLQYQELFVSSGFFTDSEWTQWFGISEPSSFGIKVPIHNYYRDNEAEKGLVRKLYHTINKKDLWWSEDVFNAFNKFLGEKAKSNNIKQAKSSSIMHTSHPSDYIQKEGVPVMFSFTKGAHNIIIYGYNSRTDELAFHVGWSGIRGENSMRIVKQSSLWSFWSFGFWNTIYIPQESRRMSRRAFEYKDEKYSWFELQAVKGSEWSEISYV